MRRLTRAAAWFTTGVALGASGLAAYTGWTINAPRRPPLPYGFTPFEIGAEAEDVRFSAEDGVSIAGWWFDAGADVTVICCHGHRGSKADLLGIGPGLFRAGFNVLVFDFRGNGDSADGPQSLAFHEQLDLAAAIDWVEGRRPGDRIAVVGFSMGAATAILTGAQDPRIQAFVLDSPFATMRDVVGAAYRKYRLPALPVLAVADVANRLRYGYRFSEVRPIEAIADLAPRPILLIHGVDDRVIPFDHAERLAEAAAPGTLQFVAVPGIDHCGAYFSDRQGYIARVAAFLRAATAPA